MWKTIKSLMPLSSWLTLLAITLTLLVLLSWRAACSDVEAAADKADIADSRMGSAEVAIEIIGDAAAADEATRQQVEEAEDAIRRETDPVRRDGVARRELCKLQRPDGPC